MLDPDSPLSIFVLVILLALYALFAAAKEAVVSMRASRRVQLIEEGNSAAEMIDRLVKNTTQLLATEQLLLKLISFFIMALVILTYTSPLALAFAVSDFGAVAIITIIAAVVILIFGELIPREIARNYADPLALWLVHPIYLTSYLTAPLARIISRVGQVLTLGADANTDNYGVGVITEDDLRTYMDASEEGGALGEEEKEMIYSIFNLDDTSTREIMIPRIDMVAIDADAPVREALDTILEAGHSRLPVYVNSVDNVVGIIYAKDLLAHWRNGGEPRPVHGLEREVYYVPEAKPVSELLRDMQAKKVQIAIVVDEYGGTAGLVTIEDIMEEIVGEIQDEYDSEEFFMERISQDEFIFSARMDLDDINDIMSTNLPTDESDTLGGLIYTILGRVPEVGDSVEVDDLYLTVLAVDGRRIKTVKIQRLGNSDDEQEHQRASAEGKNNSRLIGDARKAVRGSS